MMIWSSHADSLQRRKNNVTAPPHHHHHDHHDDQQQQQQSRRVHHLQHRSASTIQATSFLRWCWKSKFVVIWFVLVAMIVLVMVGLSSWQPQQHLQQEHPEMTVIVAALLDGVITNSASIPMRMTMADNQDHEDALRTEMRNNNLMRRSISSKSSNSMQENDDEFPIKFNTTVMKYPALSNHSNNIMPSKNGSADISLSSHPMPSPTNTSESSSVLLHHGKANGFSVRSVKLLPYTQEDIIRLIQQTRARWHVLVVVLPSASSSLASSSLSNMTSTASTNRHHFAHVIRLSKKPNAPVWGNWKEHVLELLIDGWLTYVQGTMKPNQVAVGPSTNNTTTTTTSSSSTTWQLVLDTLRDYVHLPCMMADAEASASAARRMMMRQNGGLESHKGYCFQESYPAIAAVGSISKTAHVTAPFLYQFPIKQYNQCLFSWRQRLRQQPSENHNTNNISRININNSNSQNNSDNESAYLCPLHSLVVRLASNHTRDVWDTLTPQVFWRGSSLKFLTDRPDFVHVKTCDAALPSRRELPMEEDMISIMNQTAHMLLQQQVNLTPRCLAAVMSLQANLQHTNPQHGDPAGQTLLPWINVKFSGRNRHHKAYRDKGYDFFLDNHTEPTDMSQYKYQIDFGGIGGTTWLGTLTKLAMPGLLFHHETPAKDWFHDDIQPWVHYVPIRMNLSNLYDMFLWAEAHPDDAKRIAERGQQFAQHLVSDEQFSATFENHYVQQLGAMVHAYQQPAPTETIQSIIQRYNESGVSASVSATCNEVQCQFFTAPSGEQWIVSLK